jgi:hypothetical protein
MAVRPGAAAERALWWRRPRNRWLALSGEISPELEGWRAIPRALGRIPRNQPVCRALYWQPVAHSPLPVLGRLSRA